MKAGSQTLRYVSPLGTIILTAGEPYLTGLQFADREMEDRTRAVSRQKTGIFPGQEAAIFPGQETGILSGQGEGRKRLPVLEQAVRWLDAYFSGRKPPLPPPLRFSGTPFQMAVWSALVHIPCGQTVTYGELARSMEAGNPNARRISPQAVGGAAGRNPIAILIPCHRMVGADGKLTGYAWGLERKRKLLELERKGFLE